MDIKAGNNRPLDFKPDTGFEKLTRDCSELTYGSDSVEVDLGTITEFTRTLRIDLFDDDYNPYSSPNTKGQLPFGRIWLFDLGFVKINLPYPIGTHVTYFTNGCVIAEDPKICLIKNDPFFFETDEALSLRMVQLDDSSSGGGGVGDFNIRLEMKKNFNREKGYKDIYNLKTQIYGPNKEAWLNYLSRNYDFEFYPNEDKLF